MLYLEVPSGDPTDLDPWAFKNSVRYQVEQAMSAVNIAHLERQDLGDGSRVFRIRNADIPKLPYDTAGSYLTLLDGGRPTKTRFVTADPSSGRLVLRRWQNVRG